MKPHPRFRIQIDGEYLEYTSLPEFDLPWKRDISQFMEDFLSESLNVEVMTSGSTGKPKPIIVSKERMVNSARMTGSFLGLRPGNTALLCLSARYIAGKMMLVRAIVLGLEIQCVEASTNFDIQDHYDFCAMVPQQAMAQIHDLHRIKNLIIGGGVLSSLALNQLKGLNHPGIYQTYGMTETLSHVAMKSIQNEAYRALPDINFSQTTDGRLIIDAPQLLSAPIVTNDLVELNGIHTFKFLGRADHTINSGGIKIQPELLERKLEAQIEVPFFIYGLDDDLLGQRVVLFIEARENLNLELDGLDKYERPKQIIYLDEFLWTSTDKIQRKATVTAYLRAL